MPLPLFLGLAAAAAAGSKIVKSQVEKSREVNAILEEAEARCKTEALQPKMQRTETDIQKRMRKMLFDNKFPSCGMKEPPPMSSDWPHLPSGVKILYTDSYSFIPWKTYSFYTADAIYYHNKKEGIHEFLYYDNVNSYDPSSNLVDYGEDHCKRDISSWPSSERNFIEQISHLRVISSETDTSIFEFLYNSGCIGLNNDEFRLVLQQHFKPLNTPRIIQESYRHIDALKRNEGKIELQFWAYFPMVQDIIFNEDDTDEQIREKEWLQEEREREAEEYQWKMQDAFDDLINLKDDISALYQAAIYDLYGVKFKKENIVFLDEPDFTFEGPSFIDKLNNAASSAQSFINDYADKHDLRK